MPFLFLLSYLALTSLVIGCESSADNWPAGRPQILDVNYLEQTSWDSSGLTFEVDFHDSDGDLGEGSLQLTVNDEVSSSLSLQEVFTRQVPPLALDARQGLFVVNASVDGLKLSSGEEVEFQFLLRDQAGGESNRAQLTLLTILRKE